MDEYYKFLEDWKADAEGAAREIYLMVKGMPEGSFGVSKDWEAGYRRDLAKEFISKVVSPYNFYRDRRLEKEREDAVVFMPADVKFGIREETKTKLCWAPEGTATEEADYFEFKYNDGREAKVPKTSMKEKVNDGGKFYTIRLNDIPTNIFPRGDSTNLWNIHEFKPR